MIEVWGDPEKLVVIVTLKNFLILKGIPVMHFDYASNSLNGPFKKGALFARVFLL